MPNCPSLISPPKLVTWPMTLVVVLPPSVGMSNLSGAHKSQHGREYIFASTKTSTTKGMSAIQSAPYMKAFP